MKTPNIGIYLNTLFSIIFFSYSAVILKRLIADYQLGGNSWKQGDWLINIDNVLVRRGPFGSAILRMSDFFSANPLLVVVIIQGILLVTLVFFTWCLIQKFEHSNTYWLLFLSPAFFAIFWAVDGQGGLRKELIIYVSFLLFLYALSSTRWKNPLFILSGFLFFTGLVAHEANLLFVPIYGYCGLLALHANRLDRNLAFIGLLALIVTSVFVIYFTATYSRIENTIEVCLPLLERGVSADMCNGAITYLSKNLNEATAFTARIVSSNDIIKLPFMFLLSFVSLILFAAQTDKPLKTILQLCLSVAVFTPLYFVGTDYGRWVNFGVSSFVFLAICLVVTENLKIKKEPRVSVLIICLSLSMIASPSHETGFKGLVKVGFFGDMVKSSWRALNN